MGNESVRGHEPQTFVGPKLKVPKVHEFGYSSNFAHGPGNHNRFARGWRLNLTRHIAHGKSLSPSP